MPDAEPAAFASNSLWRQGSRAFFKDQRAARVGDLVTVRVNVTDQAQFSNQTRRSRQNGENLGAEGLMGFETRLDRILPDDVRADALVGIDSDSNSRGEGSTRRSEQLSTNVAAVVTPTPAERESGHRGQAGNPRQLRSSRVGRCRSRATGRHRGQQYHRFVEDRPGPYRLWRTRPAHRRAATPLRPAGDGYPAALLTSLPARRARVRSPTNPSSRFPAAPDNPGPPPHYPSDSM